jgi:branched-chain amino acid transport system permease protein
MLLANLTRFAAPSYMAWQASGDLIVMIMLGGIATVLGPVAGAVALLVFEEILSGWTTHWMIVLGPAIVLIVLTAKKGLYGVLVDRDARDADTPPAASAPAEGSAAAAAAAVSPAERA